MSSKPSPDHPWNRSMALGASPQGKMIREGRRVRTITDELRDAEVEKALNEGRWSTKSSATVHEALGGSDGSHSSLGNGGYQRKAYRYG